MEQFDEFCELILVVRPEEKRAVLTCLDSLVGPVYTLLQGVGRGFQGMTYESVSPRAGIASLWRKNHSLVVLLPKTIVYLVLPGEHVDEVLEALRRTLQIHGGPATCARGLGYVIPLEKQIIIDGSHAALAGKAYRVSVPAAGRAAADQAQVTCPDSSARCAELPGEVKCQ